MDSLEPTDLPHILIVFSSASTAEYRVAGIPAAARAAQAIGCLAQTEDVARCVIVAGSGWAPSNDVLAESSRLAPTLKLGFSDDTPVGGTMILRGEAFVAALARRNRGRREDVRRSMYDACLNDRAVAPALLRQEDEWLKDLSRASRYILARTGKGGDGVVSRYVNRPISRSISAQLLRIPWIRPSHASLGTALLGLAMAIALFFGDRSGLWAGAVLFQAASIFDGVDGEMARATFRTSDRGATLDSVIDACTNLAFITGVTVNVGSSGDLSGAIAGGIALVTLALGLLLIGRHADAAGEPMNFDVVKRHFRKAGRRSRAMELLIHLTMRDFFAAACAFLIVVGLTHWLLLAFATIAVGWFAVTVTVLAKIAASTSGSGRRGATEGGAFDSHRMAGR
jgi:phosphatidylglycerophosphate synthase